MSMRLAVVSGFPPDPQGEANYAGLAYRTLAAAHENDLTIRVFAHAGPHRVAPVQERSNLVIEGITGTGSRRQRAAAVRHLGDRLLDWRPDVVHLQGAHTPLYGGRFGEPVVRLMRRLRRAGVPIVFTVHSTWLREDLDALWRSRQLPAPLVPLASYYYLRFMRQVLTLSDVPRICTAGDGGEVVKRFASDVGVAYERLIVEAHPCTPAPVSEEARFAARKDIGLSGKRVVVAAGFVRRDKNLHELLSAARQVLPAHPDVCIVIAGEPVGEEGKAYADELRAAAALLGANAVDLRLRFVSDVEFGKLLDSAEIVVVPYARSIGPSGPVHHALGRGRAVIASGIGHNQPLASVVSLVSPNDCTSIATALNTLLESSDAREAIERRSLTYAEQHTWAALAESYWADYCRVVARETGHATSLSTDVS